LPAEHRDEGAEEHDGHEPGVEVVVAQRPRSLAEAPETLLLQLPRRAQRTEHTAREERPERLAEACARGILGGGHAGVVAAVVLDEEVAVAGGGERDLGQPLLTSRDLVAQLVRGVDADAAGDGYGPGHADRAGDPEPAVVAEPRQIVRGPRII